MKHKFVRDFSAGEYLDLFLVTAVSAVLFIRLFLKLTGFPKLGGESLHVAHVLWGGLLMLVAIILLVSFLNRFSRKIAAVLGGAGFGAFIDEVGKFLTHDNDYFFRPTPAIIYIVFILTYLAIRSITRRRHATHTELVVNALKETGQVAVGNINHEERDRALGYLELCDQADPLVTRLKDILENSDAVEPGSADPVVRARRAAYRFYWSLTGIRWFGPALIAFFAGRLAIEVFHAISLIVFQKSWIQVLAGGGLTEKLGSETTTITYFDLSMILFSSLEAILVAAGAWLVRRSRLRAYNMFQKSILVSIFFIQPLLFYRDQWGALLGFSVNILVFLALRFMTARERLT